MIGEFEENGPEMVKVRLLAEAISTDFKADAWSILAELALKHARDPEELFADMDAVIMGSSGYSRS